MGFGREFNSKRRYGRYQSIIFGENGVTSRSDENMASISAGKLPLIIAFTTAGDVQLVVFSQLLGTQPLHSFLHYTESHRLCEIAFGVFNHSPPEMGKRLLSPKESSQY